MLTVSSHCRSHESSYRAVCDALVTAIPAYAAMRHAERSGRMGVLRGWVDAKERSPQAPGLAVRMWREDIISATR